MQTKDIQTRLSVIGGLGEDYLKNAAMNKLAADIIKSHPMEGWVTKHLTDLEVRMIHKSLLLAAVVSREEGFLEQNELYHGIAEKFV